MSKKARSQLWFALHGWASLPIWAFLTFICLTGTIAVVSEEITWLARPEMRANNPGTGQPPLDWTSLAAKVEAAHPEARVTGIIRSAPYIAPGIHTVIGEERVIFRVNRWTGEIQGRDPQFSLRQFLRATHGWLLVTSNDPVNWGWIAVSAMSLPLIVSLVTGILIYKKFWRAYLKPRLRVTKGWRTFWGDFHRFAGIWSIPFIAIIAVTGLWFLVSDVLWAFDISLYSPSGAPDLLARDAVPMTDNGMAPAMLNAQALASAISGHNPDYYISAVWLPDNPFGYARVNGFGWLPLVSESYLVDPYTGAIADHTGTATRSVMDTILLSLRPLHVGDFLGLGLKLIYVFFGALLTMMAVSGLVLWLKRTTKATAAVIRTPRVPRPPRANVQTPAE